MIMQQLKNTSQMTYQEQGLAGYILSNPRNIRTMNAKELAAAALTSPSTVTRFCKKLGYTGYPQFQLVFIEEYGQMDAGMNWEGFKSISVAEAMDHTLGLYEYVIKETIRLNTKYKLQRVMAILQRAEKIDFYGNDLNYLSLQKMCIQLRGMGILAHSYNALNQDYINSLSPKGCAGVMVSHSGNNPAMLNAAYELRRRGISTIALTSSQEHMLELTCGESLYIFADEEAGNPLARIISLDYLLNMLYLCLRARKKK